MPSFLISANSREVVVELVQEYNVDEGQIAYKTSERGNVYSFS